MEIKAKYEKERILSLKLSILTKQVAIEHLLNIEVINMKVLTGHNWMLDATHIYCPKDTTRGVQSGDGDEKARCTQGPAVDANGDFLPVFNIIKCTANQDDLRRTTVLKAINKKPGFTREEGWYEHLWEQTLYMDRNGDWQSVTFHLPYLQNQATKDVITCQVINYITLAYHSFNISVNIFPA